MRINDGNLVISPKSTFTHSVDARYKFERISDLEIRYEQAEGGKDEIFIDIDHVILKQKTGNTVVTREFAGVRSPQRLMNRTWYKLVKYF